MTKKSVFKDDSRLHRLTERETQVLRLVARGFQNRTIAAMLGIAPGTVRRHLENIFARLDVSNRAQAAVVAITLHLVDRDTSSQND